MYRKLLKLTACVMTAVVAISSANITSYAAKGTSVQHVAQQYIIAQNGTGDFTTIQAGVDAAQSGDTLIIYPGTYNEAVSVIGKEINITGVSKELCIIRSDSVSYRQSPLTVAAGTISNLTIYGMYTGNDDARNLTQEEIDAINATIDGDTWERQKNYKGYAVHVDQNSAYGKTLNFENCRIISENSHCVGIGTRGNFDINFDNCELISVGDGGCVYMHDSPLASVGGTANLIIRNSYLTSYLCPYVFTLESILPETNTTYFTFQNVKVSAVAYSESESYVADNVNTFFDVETLALLEKANLLTSAGLTTTASTLVNNLGLKESAAYMEQIYKAIETGYNAKQMANLLPEGITYITAVTDDDTISTGSTSSKHQVISVINHTNQAGDGWCGLNSAYLTDDSFGNTLIEMNPIQIPQ